MIINKVKTVGNLTFGNYEITVMQEASYSAKLYKNYVNEDNKGDELATFNSTTRTNTILFAEDASNVQIYTGSNGRYDYVLVRKISVGISAVDNLGYTFSSTLPLDFSGTSVRAYIATYDVTIQFTTWPCPERNGK